MEYLIRAALADDVAVVSDIFCRSSLSNERDRASLLANPEALVFEDASIHQQRTRVAVADGRVVGFATTLATAVEAMELEDLFVDPDWMRRGVARSLILDVVELARARGTTRVDVTANPHALAFYETAGFVIDGTVATQFGPGLRMHLEVASPTET
ncbi:MAG: GNAT family N-acetyltransferase [Acidimicrobiia bacterium]